MSAENAETKAPVDRLVMPVLSSDNTLVSALRILSVEIESADGVANSAIAEAATRMEQLIKVDNQLQVAFELLNDIAGDAAFLGLSDTMQSRVYEVIDQA
jgi:hypothetical protein